MLFRSGDSKFTFKESVDMNQFYEANMELVENDAENDTENDIESQTEGDTEKDGGNAAEEENVSEDSTESEGQQ